MTQQQIHYSEDIKTLTITSDAFNNMGFIPPKYTCDGVNVNPPLHIKNIPRETISMVLIVEDPDAPIRPWIHWMVWNVPPSSSIKENKSLGIEGVNDFRKSKYMGPCPPSGTHHYHYKVYALNELLDLNYNIDKDRLLKVISSKVIGCGELVGLYKRN